MTAKSEPLPAKQAAVAVQATPVRRASRTDAGGGLAHRRPAAQGRPAAGGPNVLRLVHGALRGRYVLAVALGLFAGAGGAAAGWKLGRPVYQSESLLRIAYQLPEVFQRTDQNEPMGHVFDTFMQSQKLLISSRRVIDVAVQNPVWKAMGRQVPANPEDYFADYMDVTVRPRSEYISVAVRDEDPATAAAAVTSIANAYAELYQSQEKQFERQRTGVLEDRQTFLQGQINQLNTQVRAIAGRYGTTTLGPIHDAAMARMNAYDAALTQLRLGLSSSATAPAARPSAAGAPGAEPGAAPPLTPEQIALNDPLMHGFLTEQNAVQRELGRLATLGYGPAYRDVVVTTAALADVRQRIARYAASYRPPPPTLVPAAAAAGPGGGSPAVVLMPGASPVAMRAQEAALAGLYKDARAEMSVIGTDQLSLRHMEAELATFRSELELLKKRIEVLKGEGALGGRMQVVSTGEIPLTPFRDPRKKMAAAAGLAGAMFPVALLVALPFVTRRYRYHDETEADVSSKVPLLGILPMLRRTDPDSPEMISAGHALHQMRVMLRAQGLREGCVAYLVTSATAGEGKTSLTFALGVSFAASRLRTLVIDADLVARRLTHSLQAEALEGLHEALEAGSLRGLVRRTVGGVYVLSAGRAAAADACAVSPAAVSALLAEARRHFDVVLIDSGPVLGSVEAAVLAPEVDGVLFAITRGQRRELAQRAMARLESLGATVTGIVFNRAHPTDAFRSTPGSGAFSSSVSSAAGSGAAAAADPVPVPNADRFALLGPLVQAVASGIPTALYGTRPPAAAAAAR